MTEIRFLGDDPPTKGVSSLADHPARKRPRTTRWLIGLVAVVAVGLGVAAWIDRVVARARRDALSVGCEENVKQILQALHQYHTTWGSYPPASVAGPDGRPWHSWRVLILPHLDKKSLYERYNFQQPWNGPDNLDLVRERVPAFSCPNHPEAAAKGYTCYAVVTGTGTLFPAPSVPARPSSIRDDPARTLLLAETANAAIPWTEPRDLEIDRMDFDLRKPTRPTISTHDQGGPHVAMVDGWVLQISPDVTAANLRALLTVDGGETVPPPQAEAR
jgi:hypothetical protein